MGGSNLAFAPVAALADSIARGELAPTALIGHYLDRIERYDEQLHAFISVSAEGALAAAVKAEEALASGNGAGPLHGIPYACKDTIQTRDLATTAGSKVLVDWQPDDDAAVVERMRAAGAILIGKNNLHEFAYGTTGENPIYGTTVNPYETTRIAGGSSSGSAAAVAAGLVPAAIGTDTGGSVRVPAALCGVVGLKPTYGRISSYGAIPFSWSLDHPGTLTRTVGDAGLMIEALAGYDPRDTASADAPPFHAAETVVGVPDGLRVGVPRRFFFENADPEILAAVRDVLAMLGRAGADIVEIDMPDMAHVRTVSLTIQMPEALSFHTPYLEERRADYGADLRAGLAAAQFILAEHYVRAKRFVQRYRMEMAAIFNMVDVIVTPTTPIVAPEVGPKMLEAGEGSEPVGNVLTRFTTFFNMTGHPALSVPCGVHPSGLPIGLQIIGRHFEEASILGLGAAIETEDGFAVPPPAAFAD